MKNIIGNSLGIRAISPPEIPFKPHVPDTAQTVSAPLVYVDSHDEIEYRVATCEVEDAKKLEANINKLGGDGRWLIQIVPREKNLLLVFCRRVID